MTHPTTIKVFVVGCSGSGKTTVARRLSEDLGLELHELDFMAWGRDGDGSLLPHERRLRLAEELACRDGWIAEGIYLGWTNSLLESADVVVWMDVPMRKALWRIFWRHIRAEVRRDNAFPGWFRLFKFMNAVVRQYRNRSTVFQPPDIPVGPDAIRRELAPYSGKVIIGRGIEVVDRLRQALGVSTS